MTEDNKDKVSPPQTGAGAPEKPTSQQEAKIGEGSGQGALATGAQKPPEKAQTAADQKVAPGATGGPAQTPAKPATPTAPAGQAAKPPAAPAKPAGPTPTPWEHERVARLKQQYGSGVKEASTYLGQNYIVVDRTIAADVLRSMRDDEKFDFLVDVTAVHYPKREGTQFDVVFNLYSFPNNERMRVKTQIKDGESVPSATPLWVTANWLERECFDMFGIQFEGHPDLRRILLPDEWKGYPLRKDYGIIQQDTEWVHINLGIESGQ